MLTPPIARPVTQPIAEIAVTPADDVGGGFEDAWAALSALPSAVAGAAPADRPVGDTARDTLGLDPAMPAIWLTPFAGTIDMARAADAAPMGSAEVVARPSPGAIDEDAEDHPAPGAPGSGQRQQMAEPVPGHGQDAPAMPEADGLVRHVVSELPAKTPPSAQDKGAAGDAAATSQGRGAPAVDNGGGTACDLTQSLAPMSPVDPSSGMSAPRDQRPAVARVATEVPVSRSASHPSSRVDAAPLPPPLSQDGITAPDVSDGSRPSAGPPAAPSPVAMADVVMLQPGSLAALSSQFPGVGTKADGGDRQAATDRKNHGALPMRPSNATPTEGVNPSSVPTKGSEAPNEATVAASDAPVVAQSAAPKDSRPARSAVDQPDMSIGVSAQPRGAVEGAAPQALAAVAQIPRDLVDRQPAKNGAEVGADRGDQVATASRAEDLAGFRVKGGDVAGLDPAMNAAAARHDAISAPTPTPHVSGHNGVAATPFPSPVTLPDDVARQLAGALPSAPDQPIELTLAPEELGRVRMILSVADEGVRLVVQAERPETAELMRRHADQLTRDFRDMGYAQINLSFETAGHPHRQPDPQAWADRGGAESRSTDRPRETYQPDATPRRAVSDGRLDLRL